MNCLFVPTVVSLGLEIHTVPHRQAHGGSVAPPVPSGSASLHCGRPRIETPSEGDSSAKRREGGSAILRRFVSESTVQELST